MKSPLTRLTERFGLPYPPDFGDWAIVNADENRPSEFIAYYNQAAPDERFDLFELIISCYEEHLMAKFGPNPQIEAEITRIVESNWTLHQPTIEYWALIDSEIPDFMNGEVNYWDITPFMRTLWQKHNP